MRRLSLLTLATLLLATGAVLAAKPEPLYPKTPDELKEEINIPYGQTPEQELKMDVYRPKAGGDKLPACVLVHGGGWVGGDKERFTPLAIGLAERGYVVANIEYRLGGVAKYPAAVQDCTLAVRFVRANAQRFGLDPQRIGAWGGSAGGHLAGLLAANPTPEIFLGPGLRETPATVQATCIMAGPTDLANVEFVEALRRAGEKSYSFQWLGQLYDSDPALYRQASPITWFSKTTGPILFITGDQDNPGRDTAALEKLKSLGVATQQTILKDAKHGCWLVRPTFEQCVEATDAWFKQYLK